MAEPVSTAFAVASVVSSIGSAITGGAASRRRRRAARLRARITRMQNAQSRRDLIRDFRMQRAQTMAAAAPAGIDIGSSFIQGQAGSLAAQTEAAETSLNTFSRLNQQAVRQELKASRLEGWGNTMGAIGQLTGNVASATGGWDNLADKMGMTTRITNSVQ